MLFAKTSRFVFIGLGYSGVLVFRSQRVCLCAVELSNLLVMRQGIHTAPLTLNLTQLRFHQIKDKEIVQVIETHFICST